MQRGALLRGPPIVGFLLSPLTRTFWVALGHQGTDNSQSTRLDMRDERVVTFSEKVISSNCSSWNW